MIRKKLDNLPERDNLHLELDILDQYIEKRLSKSHSNWLVARFKRIFKAFKNRNTETI
jgi:hypothetical protein